ncbi:hypothetical protein D8674_002911 [Pyrus ussuriensis x Pyrus communis]|uniref:Uncharacterized protein n=1 Tax=Pyrus ussuriensis x Pyrus communis TaxID=2448454 RepID=A0A5N5FFL8_9ROSA|nr:hypothetical protein D8674_002911 [Pyrus ussuriensis x Pyrus communis]
MLSSHPSSVVIYACMYSDRCDVRRSGELVEWKVAEEQNSQFSISGLGVPLFKVTVNGGFNIKVPSDPHPRKHSFITYACRTNLQKNFEMPVCETSKKLGSEEKLASHKVLKMPHKVSDKYRDMKAPLSRTSKYDSEPDECLLAFLQSKTASAGVGHWLSLLLKAADNEAA